MSMEAAGTSLGPLPWGPVLHARVFTWIQHRFLNLTCEKQINYFPIKQVLFLISLFLFFKNVDFNVMILFYIPLANLLKFCEISLHFLQSSLFPMSLAPSSTPWLIWEEVPFSLCNFQPLVLVLFCGATKYICSSNFRFLFCFFSLLLPVLFG